MVVGRFDPAERVIWVRVRLAGPLGVANLRFIFDTGTPVTILNTAAADDLGYSARMGSGRSRLLSVEGVQEGYRLKVERLEMLGFAVKLHEVFCHDFDQRLGLDGLIGMDVLAGKGLTIDGIRGILELGPRLRRRA